MGKSGVYTITCLINKKMYVGKTKQLKIRKHCHFSELKHNKHKIKDLQDDYNRYGKENFVFEVLIKCKKRFLYSEEHYWCNLLNVHNPEFGYNIQPTNPYGVGKALKSSIQKRVIKQVVPVIMLTTDGQFIKRFNSCKEAGTETKMPPESVSQVARGERSHSKGYVFVYEKDYNPSKYYSIKVLRHKRNVLMLDKNDNILGDFKSTQDAANEMGISQVSIWRALNGTRNTYKGYKWVYGDKMNEVYVYNYYKSKELINAN